MIDKHYISASKLLEDSFLLADKVYSSGFRPQFIVGIWRGGAPIGITVQEYFDYKKVPTDHISVRTSAYRGIGELHPNISVYGLHYIIENANATDNLLIVDDVFDSGKSVQALKLKLKELMRLNTPKIKVACPYYKPNNNTVDFAPDYYIHSTEEWLVFPHEISGLTIEEISKKEDLKNINHLFK